MVPEHAHSKGVYPWESMLHLLRVCCRVTEKAEAELEEHHMMWDCLSVYDTDRVHFIEHSLDGDILDDFLLDNSAKHTAGF